jgi:hypothetical protein
VNVFEQKVEQSLNIALMVLKQEAVEGTPKTRPACGYPEATFHSPVSTSQRQAADPMGSSRIYKTATMCKITDTPSNSLAQMHRLCLKDDCRRRGEILAPVLDLILHRHEPFMGAIHTKTISPDQNPPGP